MKNITLLILLTFFLFGCESPKGQRIKKGGYAIVEIDSCKYIEVSFATGLDIGYYSLTHKGNCKYCKTK